MKVNKNSWHYKLMNYFNFDIIDDLRYGSNVTLCRYFWNAVGSIIALLGAVALGLMVAALASLVLLAFVIAPISYLTQSYFGFGWDFATELGVVMIWVVWVILPLGHGLEQTIKGKMKVWPSWMKIKLLPPAASSRPNILVEYVKAKKNKFCPLVELDKE